MAQERRSDAALVASEAYRAGVERAEQEMARRPPDDGTRTVSVAGYPERRYFKLCRTCSRSPRRCVCT